MKVAVAMSGGVDSSVATALLKKEGYQVVGITMRLHDTSKDDKDRHDDSRQPDAIRQSEAVADKLDIPHIVADFRDIFTDRIINAFCREYSLGRTPNPCVRCNQYVKFGTLMEKARELEADYLATGHYARVQRDMETGKFILKKGIDRKKDQSYFLCQLTQEQLSCIMFPVGNITKENVKRIAEELNLSVNDRPESQEICFIPDNDYARFLEEYKPESISPGPILNQQGDTIGRHTGLHQYTIGQRKGLGIAAAEPLYVTAIDPDTNAVIAGSKDQTYGDELTAINLNWIAGSPPEYPATFKARIRYRHAEAEAVVTPLNDSDVHVRFSKPQMAITPGQTIVFYDGDNIIGGGIINSQGSRK